MPESKPHSVARGEVAVEMRQIADHIAEFYPASAGDLREDAAWVESLEEQYASVRAALEGVAWKDSAGLCWCPGETEFAVAHPNADHTPRCLAARAALNGNPATLPDVNDSRRPHSAWWHEQRKRAESSPASNPEVNA